ncbi:hypothetical protein [Streptomyces clavuligerus]|uniref:Uncharacterized protein n=1 Tax=Streptomyces clavuligerus TaxID=1901 RepID=D5SKZ7_STRCL|nr:hypothetical protein [Streptomyces clavuligerus]ANW22474.1 hypothetical protein BB341_29615 [Streptomyces clavuligerus]AXU17009.1 hypothetical protein D1794_30425 [Streptomyces clavuligerus]AXU17376.1 hypothetical protein D1794_32745 [Streptomyces clavuligerus]EFG04590.1 Hypothetical protein SCLAV_p1104 [Streptomyces clavuligerus]MBY6306962.1 hypothetical protein [Streptomyces clavuligerus]
MPSGKRNALPELFCPIQPRISPLRAELEADVARWMETSRLSERPAQPKRYIHSGFGSFAARVCPDAEREELLLFSRRLTFGFFYFFSFFYDDTFFDAGENHEHPGAAADAVMAMVSVRSAEGEPSGLPHRYDPDGSHRLGIATYPRGHRVDDVGPDWLRSSDAHSGTGTRNGAESGTGTGTGTAA